MKLEILCVLMTWAFFTKVHSGENATISSKCNSPSCTVGLKRNCGDWYKEGCRKSEVYVVYPASEPVKVFCDMETDGGGWTVLQRRLDGSENFYRSWKEYEMGFGNLIGEHWLGNDKLNRMTNGPQPTDRYELRVELFAFDGRHVFAKYDDFSVGSKGNNYTLNIGHFTGDIYNSLAYHNKKSFSTKDYGLVSRCAITNVGAWWFDSCHHSHLNGAYSYTSFVKYAHGIDWYQFYKSRNISLKATEMKFRPLY